MLLQNESIVEMMDNFIAGMAYGATTVLVGQPLDTIKTRMQTLGYKSAVQTARLIYGQEGILGLYRGGMSLLVGGALIRSAQFGVYENVLAFQRRYTGPSWGNENRILGIFDTQVVVAGFAGGIGRGLVEGPFEYIKTRRQVHGQWKLRELTNGAGATIFRNSFLFSSFMIYIDLSHQLVPGGLGPFWTGAICSNLAWLTIWPLDVVKSQLQSGRFEGRPYGDLLREIVTTDLAYRGLLPGLLRSFIANGLSMVVYKKVLAHLSLQRETSQS